MKIFSISPENKFKEFSEIDFQEEHQEATLESWLANNPEKIIENGNLLMIGRQVTTNLGSFIDLLAIDKQGDLVVIELKRGLTPRETLAQALEYTSFVEKLSYEQLEDLLRSYTNDEAANLAQYHQAYFNLMSDEAIVFNNDQRIVIVGQKISPEIRQTSTFLRNKGIRVTCLEFTFFKTDEGLRLLSTNIVIGNEGGGFTKISSGSMPKIVESSFMASLDRNGKRVFERLLEFAKNNSLPIHWGTKGFSMNINLDGTHIAFCFGYMPNSVFKQSIYTTLVGDDRFLSKIDLSENEIQALWSEAKNSGLFQPAGRELKCLIARPFTDKEIDSLTSWLMKIVQKAYDHGLKGQNDLQGIPPMQLKSDSINIE